MTPYLPHQRTLAWSQIFSLKTVGPSTSLEFRKISLSLSKFCCQKCNWHDHFSTQSHSISVMSQTWTSSCLSIKILWKVTKATHLLQAVTDHLVFRWQRVCGSGPGRWCHRYNDILKTCQVDLLRDLDQEQGLSPELIKFWLSGHWRACLLWFTE